MLIPVVRSVFAPLVVVAALVGSGCGSSGSGGASATHASAPAASGAASVPASPTPASTGTSPASGPAPAQTTTSATKTPSQTGAGENAQSFGSPASASEQAAVTSTVKAYYAAVAADQGTTACSLLAARVQAAIVRSLGRSALLRGKGCPVILKLLFHHQAGQAGAISPAVTVTALRVSGDRGYALISTKAKPKGDIRVEREHGAWKVAALIGSALG
jgi:hypothetical protein